MAVEKEIKIIISAVNKAKVVFDQVNSQLSGLEKMGQKMVSVGNSLNKNVTLPLTVAGGVALKVAADFDVTMKSVQAIAKSGGAAAEEIESLKDMAVEFGRKGVFGPKEVAQAMEDMVRDGLKPAEIAAGRLAGVYNMAAASGIEMGEAQIILSDTMQAFGATAEDTARYVDNLVGITLETPASMYDLAESMKYISPIAANLGVSIEEVSGLVGILAKVGIRGSMAGTSLRRSLLELASPSAEAASLMEDLGIQAFNDEGSLKPMVEVVGEVAKGLEGMTEQQKTATLETIFGTYAVTSWMAIINEGPEALEELTEAIYKEGRAQEVAQDRSEGLSASLKKLKANFETLMIEAVEPVIPIISKLAETVAKVATWFSGLSEGTKKTILIVLALVAALGPLLVIAGQIAIAISALVPVFAAIGTVIGLISLPIMAIIALIAVIVGVIVWWVKNWKQNMDTLKWAWGKLVNAIKGYVDAIKETVTQIWDKIKAVFTTIGEFFIGVAKVWAEILRPIWQPLIEATEWLSTKLTEIWQGIKDFIEPIINGIKNTVSSSIGFMKDVITSSLDALRDAWGSFWDWASGKVEEAWNKIKGPIDSIKNGISGAIDKVKGFGSNVGDTISNAVQGVKDVGSGKTEFKLWPFQHGGIVTKPTMGLLGESGPEAVIPLSSMGGGMGTINITITGNTFMSSREAAEEIGDMIASIMRRDSRF